MLRFYEAWTYFHLFCYKFYKGFWFRRNKKVKKLTMVALLRSGNWFALFLILQTFWLLRSNFDFGEIKRLKNSQWLRFSEARIYLPHFYFYKRLGFSEAEIGLPNFISTNVFASPKQFWFRRNKTFVAIQTRSIHQRRFGETKRL